MTLAELGRRPSCSVLVVEDNPGDAELVRLALTDLDEVDWTIRVVSTLLAAKEALVCDTYDAVLCDLELPDSDGPAAIRELQSLDIDLPPIIAHSGHPEVGRLALQAGADDYVVKGTQTDRLPHTVRYAMSRARLRLDLRAIVDANADAMLVTDPNGRILFANPACRKLFGRSPAELEGETFGHDSSTRSVVELEIRRGRETRTAEMRTSEVEWEGRRALVHSLRDITDRVRAQEYERRLIHSERLAAIGQLAAGVAHEINNPAAFILANLQQLDDHCHQLRGIAASDAMTTPPRVRELLREVSEMIADSQEGVRRISSIVRDLRSFARFESDALELVEVNEVVRVACRMAYNEIRHRAQLVTDLGVVRPIVAHRGQLSQVLVNLLLNATQAIEPGAPDRNSIRVTTMEDGEGSIAISVEDTGAGIPEHVRPRIFEPFFTTKPRDVGTGLGLALCAETVRKHGGEIRVESTAGQGSVFTILLPEDTGLRPSSPARPPTIAPEARARARVLLIDDDPLVRRAFLRILASRHDVEEAAGGEEGLAILAEDQAFDVILCDLMMPGVDGPAVFHQVRARSPALAERLVFVSGGAFTPSVREFLERHQPLVLEKPVSREMLVGVIARAAPQHD